MSSQYRSGVSQRTFARTEDGPDPCMTRKDGVLSKRLMRIEWDFLCCLLYV
jgi:hypothetical protein